VILNEENLGLSESRNKGIKEAKGDVIAFFDDDAVADEDWLKELERMYEEKDAIAAGRKLLPFWTNEKPKFLPGEYYWLVGVAAMSKIFAVAIQSNFSIMLNLQLFEEFLRTYSQ